MNLIDFLPQVQGFCCDSRSVKPGDLFFALPGEKTDGHLYLSEVARRGAIGAVVAREVAIEGLPLFQVKDVLQALQQMAADLFRIKKPQAIGVTGSVGKTTTKEFLATLLHGSFDVAKTPGSLNSQVGLPLSILNHLGAAQVFVMEMGMSQKGEILNLVKMAPPDIAMITQIAPAHTAFFPGGLEEIAEAKAEILTHERTRYAVIHEQAMQFSAVREVGSAARITYGRQDADWVWQKGDGGIYLKSKKGEDSPLLQMPNMPDHLVDNLVGAIVVCRLMGMSWETIAQQLPHLKTAPCRFEWVDRNGVQFLNDSYNASPASMRAALEFLRTYPRKGKLVAVLGSMRELGSFEKPAHADLGALAGEVVDQLICLGSECQVMVDRFSATGKKVEWCSSLEEVCHRLKQWIEPQDLVLMKGSNAHQLWKILDML